jgi:hypothetical protein
VDKQFEEDVAAGHLDALAGEAIRDLREGRCRDLKKGSKRGQKRGQFLALPHCWWIDIVGARSFRAVKQNVDMQGTDPFMF